MLQNELNGTIWKNVLFDKLFEQIPQTDTVMESATFDEWLGNRKSSDDKAFERQGVLWFQEFSKRCTDSTGRFYYSSCDTALMDAYHGAKRQCDIILTRRLDNLSASAHSWNDVLVVGEIKRSYTEEMVKETILQLARYVREIFGAQPGRRFVHAFTVCGHRARFWFFDRVGVSISTVHNISSTQGQKSFMHGLLSYMKMSALQLGFDGHYKDESGNTFIPNGVNNLAYLHLGDKQFKLIKILTKSHAICTRATLCWLAKERECPSGCTGGCQDCFCIVKEAWRDSKLTAENELWKLASEKQVFGSLDVLVTCEIGRASCRERV